MGILTRCITAISGFVMVLLLTGCWDRVEVNDLTLVMAAGLDKKGDKISLSVQVFVPQPSGGGGGGGGGGESDKGTSGATAQTIVRAAEGVTLADAMSKLQEGFPRRIFWGHCEIFIFGEELAKDGFRDNIDFIMRESGPRERADVFVSKGDAKSILRLIPPIERSSAEVLREMAKLQTGMKVTVKDFAEMLNGDAGAAALPWVETLPPEAGKGSQNTVGFINGTAIIKGDKMVGRLNDKLTRGLLWLRNEVESSIVTIEPKESAGHVSMKLLRSSTNLIPHIEGDQWSVTVIIKTEDDVIQNTTNLNLSDPVVTKKLEKELAEDIEERIKAALVRPQKQLNADIFNFAEAFRRKYPKEWHQVKDRWGEVFPSVKVNIEASAKILRTGMATIDSKKQNKEEVEQ